jgi:dihydropteroate synthase
MKIYLRDSFVEKDEPLVMGILNVTPDSFSDGGRHLRPADAGEQARRMVTAGVDIIDVGGESTRPGARRVSAQEELERVLPVITAIKEAFDVLVSVDTYKEEVARAAVEEAGADMINDISALAFSDAMADTVARLDVPVVLMHIRGTPETMQQNPVYGDVVAEIATCFEERIEFALSRGIRREKLILDPGIGFGKRLCDNLAILSHLAVFRRFDLPLLVGLSRKTFLGTLSGESDPARRDPESLAGAFVAAQQGAAILRVHDVDATVRALKVLRALREAPAR